MADGGSSMPSSFQCSPWALGGACEQRVVRECVQRCPGDEPTRQPLDLAAERVGQQLRAEAALPRNGISGDCFLDQLGFGGIAAEGDDPETTDVEVGHVPKCSSTSPRGSAALPRNGCCR